jgi:hypothetical protein
LRNLSDPNNNNKMSYEYKSARKFEELVKDAHSAQTWLAAFQHADMSGKKLLRTLIQRQTCEMVERHCYLTETGEKVQLDAKRLLLSCSSTVFHPTGSLSSPAQSAGASAPVIHVIEGDCLDVGLCLQKAGFNPAVLVMASRSHPGGGYKKGKMCCLSLWRVFLLTKRRTGAGAQEENLCRRSSLWQSLEDPRHVRCRDEVIRSFSPIRADI